MLAVSPVVLAVIAAVPTPVVGAAVLLPVALPLTPEVLNVSLLANPLMVSVKVGLACPYKRAWLSAVTVRCALLMVSVPLAGVKS